jgi:hypothetical protein
MGSGQLNRLLVLSPRLTGTNNLSVLDDLDQLRRVKKPSSSIMHSRILARRWQPHEQLREREADLNERKKTLRGL